MNYVKGILHIYYYMKNKDEETCVRACEREREKR